MRHLRVGVLGLGVSGRRTSLVKIAESANCNIDHSYACGRSVFFSWGVDRQVVKLELRVAIRLGWIFFDSLEKALGDPQARAELDFLNSCNGLLSVVDTQPPVLPQNVENLKRCLGFLGGMGKSLDDCPNIYILNKRDLVRELDFADAITKLGVARSDCFATIATTGEGLVEAMGALVLRMCGE